MIYTIGGLTCREFFREFRKQGIFGTLAKLYRMNLMKPGTLVGIDQFGNRYYENKKALYGQDRWVDYINPEYDATQVPPDWHAWLHHMTPYTPQQSEVQEHVPTYRKAYNQNLTGTPYRYLPPKWYSNSTRGRISSTSDQFDSNNN